MPWIVSICKVQIRGETTGEMSAKTIEAILETSQQAITTLMNLSQPRAVIWTKLVMIKSNWKRSQGMKYSRSITWLKTAKFNKKTRWWTHDRSRFAAVTLNTVKFNWISSWIRMTINLCNFSQWRRIQYPRVLTDLEAERKTYSNKETTRCYRLISSWRKVISMRPCKKWIRRWSTCRRHNVPLVRQITTLKGSLAPIWLCRKSRMNRFIHFQNRWRTGQLYQQVLLRTKKLSGKVWIKMQLRSATFMVVRLKVLAGTH